MGEFEVLVTFEPISPQCAQFDMFVPAFSYSTIQSILATARQRLAQNLASKYVLPRSRKEICSVNDYELRIGPTFAD